MTEPAANDPASSIGRVLVVDDEEALRKLVERALKRSGHEIETAADGDAAIAALRARPFDAVVSDISMPGMDGIALLRAVREQDLDLPIIILTGAPDVATAARAIEHGALRYLVKPFVPDQLCAIVGYAVRIGRLARVKRVALQLVGDAERFVGDRAGLEAHFSRALSAVWMAYQPIVSWSRREVYAYEALVRSAEPMMANPGALLSAAEQLGRLHDLGRTIRSAIAPAASPTGPKLFVNLHTRDLTDETLFAPDAPLSASAHNIVLEITERASLDDIDDVEARVQRLRAMGYHIALDDLGAGYAGLTSLSQLRPEVVKLDMSLVRAVDRDAAKQKLVGAMVNLSREMGMLVVAEGIETVGERDALIGLGCDLLQGYLFAKPAAPFPAVAW